MSPAMLFDTESCVRVVMTLAHFLWQGSAVFLVATAAALLLRRASAIARHTVFVAALLLMAACPPVTYLLWQPEAPGVGPPAPPALTDTEAPPEASPTLSVALTPFFLADGAGTIPGPPSRRVPVARGVAEGAPTPAMDWQRYAPHAVFCYFAGTALMLGRLVLGLYGGHRLRRRSQPVDDPTIRAALARQARAIGLRFTPVLAYCRHVVVPTVVGVLRPMILLPLSLASGLTAEQIEVLLAHELAHVRRYDHLVNLLQRVVEALLFFHPAVWFISRRIRIEREHCCDDMVLAAGGRRLAYAESLLRLAELGQDSHPAHWAAAAALGADGQPSQLRNRIVRLLCGTSHERIGLTRRGGVVLGIMVLAAVAAVALIPGRSPVTRDVGKAVDILSKTMIWETDRIDSALQLVRRHPNSAVLSALVEWLDAPKAAKRRAALAIFQRLPWDDPLPALVSIRKQLDDAEPMNRSMAALTLGILGDTASYDRLLHALRTEPDASARSHAAWALGELGDPRAIEALQGSIGDSAVRLSAQNAIDRLTFLQEHEKDTGEARQVVRGIWLIAGWPVQPQERVQRGMALVYSASISTRRRMLHKLKASPLEAVRVAAKYTLVSMADESSATETANRLGSADRLEQIGAALLHYSSGHGQYPESLQALVDDMALRREQLSSPLMPAATQPAYVFIRPPNTKGQPSGSAPGVLVYENLAHYGGKGTLVLWSDLQVDFAPMTELQKALAETFQRRGLPVPAATRPATDGSRPGGSGQVVYTQGHFKRPGPHQWSPAMTVLDLLELAGADRIAWVEIARDTPQGRRTVLSEAIETIRSDRTKNIELLPEDAVNGYWARLDEGAVTVDPRARADPPASRPTTRALSGPPEPTVRLTAPATQPAERVTAQVSWSDPIERDVNADSVGKDCLIDFDTGKLHSPARDPEGGFPAWFKKVGIDAGCTVEAASPGLWGFDMVVIPTSADMWDMDPARTGTDGTVSTLLHHLRSGTPTTPAVISAAGSLPATYLFRTREDATGILQILAVERQPTPHIRIRYKLLQADPKSGADASETPAHVGEAAVAPTSSPADSSAIWPRRGPASAPAARIVGTVREADGSPAEGASVCVWKSGQTSGVEPWLTTDKSGGFVYPVAVEDKTYFVSAFRTANPTDSRKPWKGKPGYLLGYQHDVKVTKGVDTKLTLEPARETGTLTVRLVAADRPPPWGVVFVGLSPIDISEEDASNKPRTPWNLHDVLGWFFVEPNKPYVIHNVPAGVIHLRGTPSDPGPLGFSESVPVEIKTGQTHAVTLKLSPRKVTASKPVVLDRPKPAVPQTRKVPETVLIKGGTFTMGPPLTSPLGYRPAVSAVEVRLDAFEIGRYEVTAEEYCEFLNQAAVATAPDPRAGVHVYLAEEPEQPLIRLWERCTIEQVGKEFRPQPDCARRPATCVSWYGAVAYCRWFSQATGRLYRLPTEAEWEFAARGTEGRLYPWGGTEIRTDYAWTPGHWMGTIQRTVQPVGSLPKDRTPEGICDLVGNMREWCSDFSSNPPSYGGTNPQGPASGTHRVLRGHGFQNPDGWEALKLTYRSWARASDTRWAYYGFRVACSLKGSESH